MAITTKSNVIISSTDGDTFVGPALIEQIIVKGGSATSTMTLKIGSVVVFDSGNVAANTSNAFQDVCIRVLGGQTATINLTGTSAKVFLYLK